MRPIAKTSPKKKKIKQLLSFFLSFSFSLSGKCVHPIAKFFFFLSFFFWRDFHCRARALARQTERDIETESEKSPPWGDGHAAIPSPPFSSRDLGHARTRARREF